MANPNGLQEQLLKTLLGVVMQTYSGGNNNGTGNGGSSSSVETLGRTDPSKQVQETDKKQQGGSNGDGEVNNDENDKKKKKTVIKIEDEDKEEAIDNDIEIVQERRKIAPLPRPRARPSATQENRAGGKVAGGNPRRDSPEIEGGEDKAPGGSRKNGKTGQPGPDIKKRSAPTEEDEPGDDDDDKENRGRAPKKRKSDNGNAIDTRQPSADLKLMITAAYGNKKEAATRASQRLKRCPTLGKLKSAAPYDKWNYSAYSWRSGDWLTKATISKELEERDQLWFEDYVLYQANLITNYLPIKEDEELFGELNTANKRNWKDEPEPVEFVQKFTGGKPKVFIPRWLFGSYTAEDFGSCKKDTLIFLAQQMKYASTSGSSIAEIASKCHEASKRAEAYDKKVYHWHMKCCILRVVKLLEDLREEEEE